MGFQTARTARPFNTCPSCAQTPCHRLTLVPHPPLNVTIVHPSQTQVSERACKRCAHCSQTPCQLLTLVPHPPESLPKPILSCALSTQARSRTATPSVTFHAHRYRSAQAGHLGLRARVGPAGTQPPHAQEPCPQILRRRRSGVPSPSIHDLLPSWTVTVPEVHLANVLGNVSTNVKFSKKNA